MQDPKRGSQFGVERDRAAGTHLGDPVGQMDVIAHSTTWLEHHCPVQPGNLACAQTSLKAEQYDDAISWGVTMGGYMDEQ